MNVATDLVLQAGPDVPKPIGGDTSSDPKYAFQRTLNGKMTVAFKTNATHAAFKVTSSDGGYVAFGPGQSMLGSTVLAGINPGSGFSPVGLYKLVSKSGSGSRVAQLVAGPGSLAGIGIINAGFSTVNGVSALTFTLVLAKQDTKFTLVPSGSASVDVIFAEGPAQFAKHSSAGSLFQANFATGGMPTRPPSGSGGSGGGSGVPSTDPAYQFQQMLNPVLMMYYSVNGNLVQIKIVQSTMGWIGFGPGTVMIGSHVLIGMDKRKTSPAVGLFSLNTQFPVNQAATLVAGSPKALARYGITGASFANVQGTSLLTFTLNADIQNPLFNLIDKTKVGGNDVIFAAGGRGFGYHTSRGVTQFSVGSGSAGPGPVTNTQAPAVSPHQYLGTIPPTPRARHGQDDD